MTLTPYLIGSTSQATGQTTITINVATGTSSGDAIIVMGDDSGTTTAQNCTDTQGNVYQFNRAATTQTPAAWSWIATASANGGATTPLGTSDQIVITMPGSGTALNAYAVGCSGFDNTVSVDISISSAGQSTAIGPLSTGTLAQPNELAVALIANGNGGGAPTSVTGGWTQQGSSLHNGTTQYASVYTQVTSSTTALSIGATQSTAANWNIIIVSLTGPNVQTFVTYSEAYCFSVAGATGASSGITFPENFTFSVNQAANVVNVWSYPVVGTYGLSSVPIANTTGNALVVFAGWNDAEINPVANVADDAHNFWTHAATSSVSGDVRCAIWICPNAQAATNLSVSLSWFAQALCVIVAEVQNFPTWAQIDFTALNFNNSTGNLTVAGTATGADLTFACVVATPTSGALIRGPGWRFIGGNTAQGPLGNKDPATTQFQAVWQTSQSGGVSENWSPSSGLAAMAGVMVGFKQAVTAPVQKNPNYPGMHVEMAFGYTPGDPTQMPTWTDVTARAIGESGKSAIDASRGRQYESEAPEAGDLKISMLNNDGAFTPGNASSPFFPNVQLGTPVRVWATWQNRAYAVAQGYVERFPQTWPDPQYGISPMEAYDALDPLSNSTLPSAYGGDVLADNPYGYWPMGDTYLQNQAAGLPLANMARTNQRPMTATDATFLTGTNPQVFNRRFLQTGLQWQTNVTGQVENFLGLPGDPNTGIGFSDDSNGDIAKGQVVVTPVPGAFYKAPDMPQPNNGVTIEFWATVDKSYNDPNHAVELLRIAGNPPNYYYNHDRGARLAVRAGTGPGVLNVTFWGFFGDINNYTYTGVTPTDGMPHHYAVTVGPASGQYNFNVYMDGVALTPAGGTTTGGGMSTPQDWNYIGVGAVPHNDGGVAYGYIYTAGQVAYYGSILPATRIAAHYNSGWLASTGDNSVTRIAKILTWGGFGLGRATATASPSPLFGAADQLQDSSAADAINTVATTDGGMFFCDAAGNATWWPRTFLYNRPVKWTLGDNPGETPYDPAEAYDFDNTFIQNYLTIQRQQNENSNGALVAVADQTSEKQYFVRQGQQSTIETTSDEDAFDQAQWLLAKYKQPALRVQQVVLNPAANAAVWPVALGIEQGDIVQLNRRPLGGAAISQKCIVQQVQHSTGPDLWQTTLSLIPYAIESTVLTCDTSGFNVVGNNGIGW